MDENSPTAVVTYKTRAEAERVGTQNLAQPYSQCVDLWPFFVLVCLQAALHGLRFNNQTLRLAWHKPATTLSTAEEEEEQQEDEVCGGFWLCRTDFRMGLVENLVLYVACYEH